MTHDEHAAEWLGQDEPWSVELREALQAADREDGTPEQVARLSARLGPLLSEAATPQGAPKPSTISLSSGALKTLTAAVALIGVGALVWPQREQAQRTLPANSQTDATNLDGRGIAEPGPYVVLAPESALEETASSDMQRPSATERTVEERAPAQRTSGASAEHSLALEARLLKRARSALGAQPAEALRLTEQHRLRFAQGALVEEREAIAIKALRELGAQQVAAARQARFEARFPQSPHLASLRSQAKDSRD